MRRAMLDTVEKICSFILIFQESSRLIWKTKSILGYLSVQNYALLNRTVLLHLPFIKVFHFLTTNLSINDGEL